MDNCPLCGSRLSWWDRKEPTKCRWCGATVQPPPPPPPTLFESVAADVAKLMEGPGQARHTDSITSKLAAQMVKARATSQRVRLLEAFWDDRLGNGLTDEEAATAAGVSLASEYATRCSELRRGGLIAPTGATRPGAAGTPREVSKITAAGVSVMAERMALR